MKLKETFAETIQSKGKPVFLQTLKDSIIIFVPAFIAGLVAIQFSVPNQWSCIISLIVMFLSAFVNQLNKARENVTGKN
jgi:membrane protein YdbS with pleckstrin-like domain